MKKILLYFVFIVLGFQQADAQCPDGLTVNPSSTNTICGDVTGSGTASAGASGGLTPYTYSWDDPNSQTTATATGLTAGSYNITVEDANGCFVGEGVSVGTASGVNYYTVITNVTCFGLNDGVATVHASEEDNLPFKPFTYSWAPSGGTDSTASTLTAGTYTCTITNSQACQSLAIVHITQPQQMRDSVVSTSTFPACNNTTADIDIGVKGGTTPYTYSWSPGGNTSNPATTITAGTYTVTVTDKNGCTTTSNLVVIITQPLPLTVSPTNSPATCANNNGTANSNAAGGTTPYTYLWSPGSQTTAIATGLSAGTYTITVTDFNGCVASSTTIVSAPAPPVVSQSSIQNIKCNGNNTGAISVSVSGGTTPFTYVWNPNVSTTSSATGLSAGTYTITVTDFYACTSSIAIILTQPTPLLAGIPTSTGVACNGGNNGTATANPSGGSTPYTYLWSDPSAQTTDPATSLTAGTYTVTITDNNSCSVTTSVVVTQPFAIRDSVVTQTNVTCNGASTGSVTIGAKYGAAPYTYAWTPNVGTTATVTGLSAGTYTLVVTDNNGCSVTNNTIIITQPLTLTATPTSTPATCIGSSMGTASAGPSGGTTPYTYTWSVNTGSQTTETATGLSAGTYTITLADHCSASTTASVVVEQPGPLTANPPTSTGVTCIGGDNGTATETPSGGTTPYTYLWSLNAGLQITAEATGLSIGTYTVTVTDICLDPPSTATVVITQPGTLTANPPSITGVICRGGSTGTATEAPSGGTTPYTYSWTTIPVQTTAEATGLSAGTYTVTVRDICGDHGSTASVVVTQPNALSAGSATSTGVTCNGGNNGTATANPSGGTSPYTYLWSDPSAQTINPATGLSAGTYTVTVIDNCTVEVTTSVIVTQPPALATSPTFTGVQCNGGSTGTAIANASGGTTPYTYLWSDPSAQTTATATGLSAGTYTITVTDICSATTTGSVVVTQPNPLSASPTTTGETCIGTPDGTATANASDGTPPYTYLWSDVDAQTTSTATGLSTGTYTVTVTDICGGTTSAPVSVTQPNPLTANTPSFTGVNCLGGNDGTATEVPSGGTTPYTYLWSDPSTQTTATATGLTAGTYTVTVTDACSDPSSTSSVVVTQPGPLVANTPSCTGVLCNGGSTGTATEIPSGGTTPYTYTWSVNAGAQTTPTATGLSAGTYTVSVDDICLDHTATASVIVSEPTVLLAGTATSTGVLCNGGSTGTATANPSGGTTPYTYLWSDPGAQTSNPAIGLSVGTYTVSITDNNFCSTSTSVVVTQPSAVRDSISAVTYPTCINGTGTATVGVKDGTTPYTYLWSDPSAQTTATATGLTAGSYSATVTDNNGCQTTVPITITQPGVLRDSIVDAATVNETCNGGNTGSVTVGVKYGTLPYTYLWSVNAGAQTTPTATGLSAGTYTIIVQDNCGASQSSPVTITEPIALSAGTPSNTGIVCNGASTGTATANPGNGTSPYTYSWSPGGQTTVTATGLSIGTYTVTEIDNCGASVTASVTIMQAPSVVANPPTSTGSFCFGGNSGTATETPSSGTTPYTYSWSPTGGTGQTGTGLSAGTYTVTVQDNCGNSATATVTITQAPSVTLGASSSIGVSCNGGSDGTATITASSGTTPYTYSWIPSGQATSTATGLNAGTYTATAMDNCGNSVSATVTVTQPSVISQNDSIINILCKNTSSGSIIVRTSGGTSPYTYTWSSNAGSQTTATATGLSAGSYTVTITDAHGCSIDSTLTVGTSNRSIYANAGSFQAIAKGQSVTLGGSPTGPSLSSYMWTPDLELNNDTIANPIASPTVTTQYTVTVSDAIGCKATDTVTVYLYPPLVVPNFLTPNYSVDNTWKLDFAQEFPNMEVFIYDRWGKEMYHCQGTYIPWNGTNKGGSIVADGTYYYVINLNDSKFPVQKGFITVVK